MATSEYVVRNGRWRMFRLGPRDEARAGREPRSEVAREHRHAVLRRLELGCERDRVRHLDLNRAEICAVPRHRSDSLRQVETDLRVAVDVDDRAPEAAGPPEPWLSEQTQPGFRNLGPHGDVRMADLHPQ